MQTFRPACLPSPLGPTGAPSLKFAGRWGFPNCVQMFGLRHWRSPKEIGYAALRTANIGSAASMPFGKVPGMNNRLLSAVA